MDAKKPCRICGASTPLEEFAFNSEGKRGNRCRTCRASHQAKKAKARKQRTLEGIEKAAVDLFRKGAAAGGENVPHVSEVLERVMGLFGGSGGFASALVKQYFDAPPGSATRTKMLETITRLTAQASELGATKKPLEFWTDAELEQELDRRIASVLPFRVINHEERQRLNGESLNLPGVGEPGGEPEDHEIPAEAADGSASGDLLETDRSDQDVPSDSEPGRDAPLQGE